MTKEKCVIYKDNGIWYLMEIRSVPELSGHAALVSMIEDRNSMGEPLGRHTFEPIYALVDNKWRIAILEHKLWRPAKVNVGLEVGNSVSTFLNQVYDFGNEHGGTILTPATFEA